MKLLSLVTFSFISLFLSGCVSINIPNEYPKEWAEFEGIDNDACPEISGTYNNLTSEYSGCPDFHHKIVGCDFFYSCGLLTDYLDVEFSGSHVVLDNKNKNELIISVYKDETLVGTKVLLRSKDEFSCKNNALVIKRSDIIPAEPIGSISFNRRFYHSIDGALIMQATEKWSVIAGFFLPISTTDTDWLRWIPCKKDK